MTSDIRIGHVMGLPAILAGRLVGRVERVVLEQDGHHLRGLVIRRGLGGARWASRDSVSVLGDVSVILDATPVRPPRDADFALSAVHDESGLTLGRVTDAWLCPETLSVTALEVTLGPAEDLLNGRMKVCQWTVQPGADGSAQVLLPRTVWQRQDAPSTAP